MAVALTVTFQGRGLLLTISVTYVVIPGVPGPPFLLLLRDPLDKCLSSRAALRSRG